MSINNQRDLLNSLQSEIKERLQWEIEHGNIPEDCTRDELLDELNDISNEIIDNNLPIYYHDMATLLASNARFAEVEDYELLPQNPSVWDIISMSVFEWLSSEYYGLCNDVIDELMPELE